LKIDVSKEGGDQAEKYSEHVRNQNTAISE